MSAAANYAAITNGVEALISKHAENDRARAAYLVCRAAILTVRAERGDRAAAEMAYRLADEVAVLGGAANG